MRIDDGSVYVFRDVELLSIHRPLGGARFAYTAERVGDGRSVRLDAVVGTDAWDALLAAFGVIDAAGLSGKRWRFSREGSPLWRPEPDPDFGPSLLRDPVFFEAWLQGERLRAIQPATPAVVGPAPEAR